MSKWSMFAVLVAFSLGFVAACSGPDAKREICGNGIDDDGNGLADCDDPDCAGQPQCPVPYYGDKKICAKCGAVCTTQADCISNNWVGDWPVPLCTSGHCTALTPRMDVRFELDTKTSWSGAVPPKSASTRFIKKTALDGSPVTCATLTATASDRLNPSSIEQSGKYLIQAIDVTPVTNPQLGQGLTYPFVNVTTGDNFLVWEEFWIGPVDGITTKMPTGKRLGFGCWEAAADVGGPLVDADNCPNSENDGGVCRTFRVKMPPPEP